MSTATIEKGSDVVVSVEGEFTGTDAAGNRVVVTKDGMSITVPENAETYVTRQPVPKEPKSNSLVHCGSYIYKRDSYYGWWRVDGKREYDSAGRQKFYTWRELNDMWGRGALRRLVDDKTGDALDLADDKGVNFGGLHAAVKPNLYGDKELTVTVDSFGCKGVAGRTAARDFAFAILRATGGL